MDTTRASNINHGRNNLDPEDSKRAYAMAPCHCSASGAFDRKTARIFPFPYELEYIPGHFSQFDVRCRVGSLKAKRQVKK